MSGVSFQLDDQVARRALDAVMRVAREPSGALHAIGAHMVTSTQRNIETETSPDGARFVPLSPLTAARRVNGRPRGFDHILRVRNRLYQSIAYQVGPNSVEWGSNLTYSRIHQLGGTTTIPEYEREVHFRAVRTKGGGIRKLFAKKTAKGAEARTVRFGARKIVVPARPYLGLSARDREDIPEIVTDYIRAEVGA